jgi:uncharacterized membrane protein
VSELSSFLARFHPVLVHVPIGALLVAAILEALARTSRWSGVRPAVVPVVAAGAASALAAAVTGYLLGQSGGYAGATFAWHERAGIAVAASSVAAAIGYLVSRRSPRPVIAPVLLALTLLPIFIAGHLGARLTHGEGYLTEHLPSWLGRARAADTPSRVPADVRVYTDLVAPVLRQKCGTCHGGEAPRGGLRLDTPQGIRKGGDSGAVLVPGRSASSEIVRRVWLPPSHKDAMPPGGRRALTVVEASLVRWWIDQGAPFDATLADVEIDAQLRPAIESLVGRLQPGAPAILAVKVPPADPAALAAVRALGVSVAPLSAATSLLQVHCTNVARTFGDAELARLSPIAPQVTWLSLAGTQVTDGGLAVLTTFTNLTRLHLDRTRVTDAGLRHVAGLTRLEYLNLYGSRVTDAGLAQLGGLGALRQLYAWRTGVTPAGAERLRARLPKLAIDLGAPAAQSAATDAPAPRGGAAVGTERPRRPVVRRRPTIAQWREMRASVRTRAARDGAPTRPDSEPGVFVHRQFRRASQRTVAGESGDERAGRAEGAGLDARHRPS